MISYIYLVSHPCSIESFRPNSDSSHLSRRDALCRIASLSLWAAPKHPHPSCDDVTFLFNEPDTRNKEGKGRAHHEGQAVLQMTSAVVDSLPVPSEKGLLSLWRESCQIASTTRRRTITTHLNEPCICSLDPATEVSLFSSGSGSSSSRSGNDRGRVSVTTGGLDKRSILKALQEQCPLDFLRKHKLNCSEDVAVKKRKRGEIEAAHHEWQCQMAQGGGNKAARADSMEPYVGTIPWVQCSSLVNTFKVLLRRAMQRTKGGRVRVLLLHEDYEEELGVFGFMNKGSEQSAPIDRVVCVLGAVRDMHVSEERALLEAAASLTITCVGANLGRTAEFTSKIAATFNCHSFKRLGVSLMTRAVGALTPVTSTEMGKLSPQRNSMNHAPQPTATDGDGESVPLSFHVVFWTGVPASDLEIAPKDMALAMRIALSSMVQVVVCTLWRSRLVSEESNGATSGQPATPPALIPELTLVFSCGTTLYMSQRQLAIRMGERHQAAPSEAQILQALAELIFERGPQEKEKVKPEQHTESRTDIASVLKTVLAKKKPRKRVYMLNVANIVSSAHALPGSRVPSIPSGGRVFDLASAAYAEACACGQDGGSSKSDCWGRGQEVIVLLRHQSSIAPEDEHVMHEALCDAAVAKGKGNKNPKKRHLSASLLGGHPIGPNAAVTICQHFAYHGRLIPAIRKGTKYFSRAEETLDSRLL